MRLAILLATLALLFAGCSDDDGGDTTPTPTPTPDGDGAPMEDMVFRLNGTSGVGAGVPGGGSISSQGDSLDFTVEENATLLYAELAWDDPVTDLDIAVRSPAAQDQANVQTYDHGVQGGGPGQPDSPHSLTLSGSDLMAGAWSATAFANGASAGVPFRLAVTVFYGADAVPEGYTALG